MKTATTPAPQITSPKKPCKDNNEHNTAAEVALATAMALLKPMSDFHLEVEEAAQNDMRMFFDVRIVRGKDTPFCHVQGTSSLPMMLAQNMCIAATTKIQQEITDKIMEPLVAALQTEVENLSNADLALQGNYNQLTSYEDDLPTADDELI